MSKVSTPLSERSIKIQSQLHSVIDEGMNHPDGNTASYQDYVTAFFINRIAVLELELEQLKDKK